MKRFSILFFAAIVASLIFAKAYIPKIGVIGSASYKDELVSIVSKLYELVPIEKKEEQIITQIWKEQDIGLRKEKLKSLHQFPDVDYIIELSDYRVTFYELSGATVKKIQVGKKNPTKSILEYFQSFVLLFELPVFIDRTAARGSWYAILDENKNVLGYYKNESTSTEISIPMQRFKNAVYARKLRKAVIHNDEIIYEIAEKDLNVQIVSEKYFEVFEDGQDVDLTVLVNEGGFLYVFDIYKDDIICVKSDPVERGGYTFSFTAYKGENNVKETLIFALEKTSIECNKLSFERLKKLLQMSNGVDLITFVVK